MEDPVERALRMADMHALDRPTVESVLAAEVRRLRTELAVATEDVRDANAVESIARGENTRLTGQLERLRERDEVAAAVAPEWAKDSSMRDWFTDVWPELAKALDALARAHGEEA